MKPLLPQAHANQRVTPSTASRTILLLVWGSVVSLLATLPAQAQTTTDYYLYGSGSAANPPTVFLNTTAPADTTAKYKDSASVNFSGGNPWKEVGTWPTTPVPPSVTLTAVQPVHVWLGLKNSDDQGTNFDLLAELSKNGAVVTSGLTRCITGITRNQDLALEVMVSFGSMASEPLNGTNDSLSLKLSTRIGTNPDNTKCAGHNNAAGLRLYFDATTRQARLGLTKGSNPTPTSLTPNPLTIVVGATGTLTATIAPAPTQDGILTVSSDNPNVAAVPASVSFTSGQTQVPFPVTTVGMGTAMITASLNGGSATSTVHVTAQAPTVTSLVPSNATITQGGTGTLTVTISAAQPTDTAVSLASTAPGIAFVPSSVTVPAGQVSAPVPASANTPGSAQISASLNSTSATSTITVTPALPTVVSLLPPITPVTIGATVTLTVTISASQPIATVVAITASPTSIVTVPASVTVPAGHLTAPVPVGTLALGTAMVQASLNGSTADTAVQVTPPAPQVVALGPSPLSAAVGATGHLTVTLNAAQPTTTDVALSVDNTSILQVPATVPVPAGQFHAMFTVTGLAAGNAVVTATLGTSTQQATVQVVVGAAQVVALAPTPLPLEQGATGTLTLMLNAAQPTDTMVPLTNSAPTILQAPSTITVPAGQTSAAGSVTGILVGTGVVTATLSGTSVSATVHVVPPPTVVTALVPNTQTLPKGKPGVLGVMVSPAPKATTPVTLASSAAGVATVPATVPIPAGALFADFPVLSNGVGTATITASLNGGTATAQMTVTPAELVTLSLSPQNSTAFVGESVQFTATGTFTDGATQTLTTTVTWSSSHEAVATITSSGVATALAVGTMTITATATGPSSPVTASTDLTVQPQPALSINPASATVQIPNSLTLTVTSAVSAGTSGLAVTFAASGIGGVTITPTSVVIPEGQNSGQVQVTATSMGQVTITVTAPMRQPANSTITVTTGVPTITSFAPTSGPVGTVVTITGTSFHTVAAENQVKFNGKPAIITSATGTSITTTVPQGATTGMITVTTAQGTATSAQSFTVTAPDFTLSALPTPLTIPASGQGAFAVSVSGTSGFTNLATLSVTGVPSGASAAFSSATLTAGQSAFLTLVTNGTTPAGTYPLTVTATGLVNGVQTPRSTTINMQVLGAGTTTLSGQVRDEDDKPEKGAVVKLGPLQVTTDDGGNFLMQNPPVGADQLFFIDGGPASTPGRNLPIIPYKVTIVAGQANVLGFIPKLHFQKTTGLVDISNSTVERTVTDPELPGFMMTIPAGATITGWDGQPNTQISIRRVPIDRTPLPPLPGDRYSPTVFMDYFGKPGGGTPSEPIPITYPNDLELPPGTQVELWFYDEAPDGSRPNQWAQYGTGTVSADGSQVISDINPATGKPFGQPRFCCGAARMAMLLQQMQPILELLGGPSPGRVPGGDPVDLATGLFIMEKTDMALPGRLPIVITRTYRTNGAATGPFGPGTSHTYHVLLLVQGDLRTLVLPGGLRLAFPKQPDGKFRNTTDPSVRGAVLTDAGTNHTLRFKDGTTWTFGTPVFGTAFLISQADRNGNTITLTRSGQTQNITTMTAPDGRQLTLSYDGGNRIVQIIDPLGRSVLYSYDAGGRLVTLVDPEGGATRYTYDGNGRMLTITDAREITFLTNEYDSESRVIRQTLADSGVWQFAYTTTAGIVTQTTVTDPRGNVTTSRFNGQRYALSQADALGQTTASTRDPASNLLLATTDPLGRKTTFEYDAGGNVTKITDPDNKMTRFEYEPTFNRVKKITDALNQITEFTYDPANGNLLTVKDPLNHATTIAYNSFGQPTSLQGPIPTEPPTTFAYDPNGNLITTTDPLGNQTQRAYDTVSRLISLTDPRKLFTQFRYDNLNRVTEIADARHGLTVLSYDPNGNLLTVTDAKNQTTTYTYDNMDRLATRKDALNRQESYQYDAAGNLSQFTDRKNQQSTFQYDTLNRRTSTSYQDGSSTTLIFDSVGRLSRSTDSIAGTIEFTYDNLDRLVKELTPQGVVTYQYDALGRRANMTANGQQEVTYQYDAASRLTQVAQGTQTVGLGYDNAGRRTSLTYPNGTSTTYGYDNASRLNIIVHNGPAGLIESLSYTYDAAGNRISLTRSNGTATNLPAAVQAAYDAANEQIQFVGANLTYDQNGNLTNDGSNTFQWDSRNRLIGISGAMTASFVYDALGRRMSKTINGVRTQFLYDAKDIVSEIGGGSVEANYLRSLNIDEPFIRQGMTDEFYHLDALGSTFALTNALGATTVNYNYEAFGSAVVSGTSKNSSQFTGRENDGTGVFYYRNRYYHPRLQRFISPDSFGLRGGDTNFYAYVGNSPVKSTDPLGFYVRDVHYDLTRWLALQVGFSPQSAADIASADQGLDDNLGTTAIANPLAGQYLHFTNDNQLDILRQRAFDGNGDLPKLGQYLHALQDTYAHNGYWPSWPGHAWDSLFGDDPDSTCTDIDKALEMARDTYNQLRAYRMRRSGTPIPYNFDDQMVGRKIRMLGRCEAS